jgi:hypothetical protein
MIYKGKKSENAERNDFDAEKFITIGPFACCRFRDQKSLHFQCLPLPMALVMDMPPSRGGAVRSVFTSYCSAPPPFPQRYKVYLLRTAAPPLTGANPLQGPLKGVGPENRDLTARCTAAFRNQNRYVKRIRYDASGT